MMTNILFENIRVLSRVSYLFRDVGLVSEDVETKKGLCKNGIMMEQRRFGKSMVHAKVH